MDGFSERAIYIIDTEGIIRYIDIHEKDDQPDNDILFAELERLNPEKSQGEQPQEETPVELPSGGIVLYCDDYCLDCKKARVWLKRQNLEFREVDVNRVPGAAAQVRAWGGGNLITPTFDIDGTIVFDFDISRLREVLKDQIKF